MATFINVARNAMRPHWGREMARKLWVRWSERSLSRTRQESAAWCHLHQIDAGEWARSIDPSLWEEAQRFAGRQQELAEIKSAELQLHVGGSAFSELLYFLTRLLRPQVIVETGVAFGFSSRAFLGALEENGAGVLLSSDFPYFRLANPERLIGALVEPELRERWTLIVGSDRDNLPRIADSISQIDLLHYDSDKSHSGRAFALQCLGPLLTSNSVVIFDDIQDNLHFRHWTEEEKGDFLAFECRGKWIGVRGGPPRLYSTDAASPIVGA